MKTYFALFCLVVGIGVANAATNKCNACLEDTFDNCDPDDTLDCTMPASESCFSAAGRYKLKNGSETVFTGVSRGCVACPNVDTGCAKFKVWFDAQPDNWTLLACNMTCCTGDQCNNQTTVAFPDLPKTTPATTATGTKGYTEKPTTSHVIRHSPIALILAIAAIVGAFFFY